MKYLSFLLLFVFISISSNGQNDDWPSYGKDSGGGHFSKAIEIRYCQCGREPQGSGC